jgi:hypothetical protein
MAASFFKESTFEFSELTRKIISLKEKGVSISEISERTHCAVGTINAYIQKYEFYAPIPIKDRLRINTYTLLDLFGIKTKGEMYAALESQKITPATWKVGKATYVELCQWAGFKPVLANKNSRKKVTLPICVKGGRKVRRLGR